MSGAKLKHTPSRSLIDAVRINSTCLRLFFSELGLALKQSGGRRFGQIITEKLVVNVHFLNPFEK